MFGPLIDNLSTPFSSLGYFGTFSFFGMRVGSSKRTPVQSERRTSQCCHPNKTPCSSTNLRESIQKTSVRGTPGCASKINRASEASQIVEPLINQLRLEEDEDLYLSVYQKHHQRGRNTQTRSILRSGGTHRRNLPRV